jgi:small subunit ribosomal protein S20
MANIKSSKKRAVQSAKRASINHSRSTRIRSAVKKVETAIAAGKKDDAVAAFKVAQPELMRGATKGVLHKNTVSRKLSRLSARIKSI